MIVWFSQTALLQWLKGLSVSLLIAYAFGASLPNQSSAHLVLLWAAFQSSLSTASLLEMSSPQL